MRLDIRFVGVKANEILIERVNELLEHELGRRIEAIDRIQLNIGECPQDRHSSCVIGKAEILLKNGAEVQVETTSAKLMTLIDACVKELEQQLDKDSSSLGSFSNHGHSFVPSLSSDYQSL